MFVISVVTFVVDDNMSGDTILFKDKKLKIPEQDSVLVMDVDDNKSLNMELPNKLLLVRKCVRKELTEWLLDSKAEPTNVRKKGKLTLIQLLFMIHFNDGDVILMKSRVMAIVANEESHNWATKEKIRVPEGILDCKLSCSNGW